MSSEGCRCRLATNVIWKAVPGSRTCIREGPLVEPGKCTRHNIVHSGRWSKTTASSCCRNSLYSRTSGGCYYQHGCVSWTQTTSSVDVRCPDVQMSDVQQDTTQSTTIPHLRNTKHYKFNLLPAAAVSSCAGWTAASHWIQQSAACDQCIGASQRHCWLWRSTHGPHMSYTQLHAVNIITNTLRTIRYDIVYLTCSKTLTGSQLSLPHGINKKLKCESKNKTMSVIGPVQTHHHEAVQEVKEDYGGKDLLKR